MALGFDLSCQPKSPSFLGGPARGLARAPATCREAAALPAASRFQPRRLAPPPIVAWRSPVSHEASLRPFPRGEPIYRAQVGPRPAKSSLGAFHRNAREPRRETARRTTDGTVTTPRPSRSAKRFVSSAARTRPPDSDSGQGRTIRARPSSLGRELPAGRASPPFFVAGFGNRPYDRWSARNAVGSPHRHRTERFRSQRQHPLSLPRKAGPRSAPRRPASPPGAFPASAAALHGHRVASSPTAAADNPSGRGSETIFVCLARNGHTPSTLEKRKCRPPTLATQQIDGLPSAAEVRSTDAALPSPLPLSPLDESAAVPWPSPTEGGGREDRFAPIVLIRRFGRHYRCRTAPVRPPGALDPPRSPSSQAHRAPRGLRQNQLRELLFPGPGDRAASPRRAAQKPPAPCFRYGVSKASRGGTRDRLIPPARLFSPVFYVLVVSSLKQGHKSEALRACEATWFWPPGTSLSRETIPSPDPQDHPNHLRRTSLSPNSAQIASEPARLVKRGRPARAHTAWSGESTHSLNLPLDSPRKLLLRQGLPWVKSNPELSRAPNVPKTRPCRRLRAEPLPERGRA